MAMTCTRTPAERRVTAKPTASPWWGSARRWRPAPARTTSTWRLKSRSAICRPLPHRRQPPRRLGRPPRHGLMVGCGGGDHNTVLASWLTYCDLRYSDRTCDQFLFLFTGTIRVSSSTLFIVQMHILHNKYLPKHLKTLLLVQSILSIHHVHLYLYLRFHLLCLLFKMLCRHYDISNISFGVMLDQNILPEYLLRKTFSMS